MLDLRLNKGPGPALCFVRQMPPSSMRAFMPSVTNKFVGTAVTFDKLVATGDHARDNGKWHAAAGYYRQAMELRPCALGIAVQMGHALKEVGQYADAEAAYRLFLAENATDADIHLQMGHLFMRQERYDEALRWYERALALAVEGSTIESDASLGINQAASGPLLKKRCAALLLTDLSRFVEARTALLPLVEEAACEDLTGILGNVCKELGRLEEARAYYLRYRAYAATTSLDAVFDAELQMGHFEKMQRNYAGALAHFARADAAFANAARQSCTRHALEAEIRTCLSQITQAITLI
jgi:tetratricopeptide (TPR) repeat protein